MTEPDTEAPREEEPREEELREEPPPSNTRWRGRGTRALVWLVIVGGIWLLGDALYTACVAAAVDAWASEVDLTAAGVIAGCEAYDLPPADETSEHGAVLLVHGFNASPRHWEFVAPALAERNLYVRVMRLPGFAEPFALYAQRDPRDWVAAVSAELAALRAEHARVGVVGHSLGGAVAIRTLIDAPTAADWAVLVAPAVEVSSARSPVLSTRTWHEVSQRLLLFTSVVKSPFPMDCQVPGRTDWPGRMPFSSAQIVDALFDLLDNNAPHAERFATPVTMLLAADDQIVDTTAAREYFDRLGTPQKELIVLKESGHEVPLDSEWPVVVDAIESRASTANRITAPEQAPRAE